MLRELQDSDAHLKTAVLVLLVGAAILVAACSGESNESQYEKWLAEHPQGTNGATNAPGSGGGGGTTTTSEPTLPPDAGATKPPANACTTGVKWTDGDKGSTLMHPGKACLDCHDNHRAAPDLNVAGTAFEKDHEPDDCNGSANVVIELSDLRGRTATFTTNAAGNFLGNTGKLSTPYKVKVSRNGKERVMKALVVDGDCNGCHGEPGRDGATRIIAP